MTHREVLKASWVEHVEYIARMPGCILIVSNEMVNHRDARWYWKATEFYSEESVGLNPGNFYNTKDEAMDAAVEWYHG